MGDITVHVVPQEVSEDGDERVVELCHSQAVLSIEIIGLTLSPVKPLHSLVGVGPEPLPGGVFVMTLLESQTLRWS